MTLTDLIGNHSRAFATALPLKNISVCFMGCMIGMLSGVLPGAGPIATIAMLLPLTLGLDPVGALIMLAGIERPLSASLLVLAIVLVIIAVLSEIRQRRDTVFQEEPIDALSRTNVGQNERPSRTDTLGRGPRHRCR